MNEVARREVLASIGPAGCRRTRGLRCNTRTRAGVRHSVLKVTGWSNAVTMGCPGQSGPTVRGQSGLPSETRRLPANSISSGLVICRLTMTRRPVLKGAVDVGNHRPSGDQVQIGHRPRDSRTGDDDRALAGFARQRHWRTSAVALKPPLVRVKQMRSPSGERCQWASLIPGPGSPASRRPGCRLAVDVRVSGGVGVVAMEVDGLGVRGSRRACLRTARRWSGRSS